MIAKLKRKNEKYKFTLALEMNIYVFKHLHAMFRSSKPTIVRQQCIPKMLLVYPCLQFTPAK